MRLRGEGSCLLGRTEARTASICEEVEYAREEPFTFSLLTDVDESHTGELASQHSLDASARGGIQAVENAIQHQPLRPLQQDASDRQRLLLVIVQLPVPACVGIEERLQPLESDRRQSTLGSGGIEVVRGAWIAQCGT